MERCITPSVPPLPPHGGLAGSWLSAQHMPAVWWHKRCSIGAPSPNLPSTYLVLQPLFPSLQQQLQFPWGFQPPKGFKLPHYVPRTPASVPTPKQLGYTMPGEACSLSWP